MLGCLSEFISTATDKQILDALRLVWYSLGYILGRGRKSLPYNFCTECVSLKRHYHTYDANPSITTTFNFQDEHNWQNKSLYFGKNSQ
jgi:hypothetical protein